MSIRKVKAFGQNFAHIKKQKDEKQERIASCMQDIAIDRLGANNWRVHAKFYTRDGSEALRTLSIKHADLEQALITVEAMRQAARQTDNESFERMFAKGTSWQVIASPDDKSKFEIFRFNPKADEGKQWQPLIIPRSWRNLWDPKADAVGLTSKPEKGNSRFTFSMSDPINDPAYQAKDWKKRLFNTALGGMMSGMGEIPGLGNLGEKMGLSTKRTRIDDLVDTYEELHKEGRYRAEDHLAVWAERDPEGELDDLQGPQAPIDRAAEWINPSLTAEQRAEIERLSV